MPAETNFGVGATGLWIMLFVFSKIPELFDTAFIVLRKTRLIFLHWYHHITVLLFCWHSFGSRASSGLYFVAMNYGVHAVMYFYYFLAARGRKNIRWAPLVTALQISQMFVGIIISLAAVYYRYNEPQGCDVTSANLWAGLAMYASYFVLFLVFALDRYIFPQPPQAPSKPKAAAAAAAAEAAAPRPVPVAGAASAKGAVRSPTGRRPSTATADPTPTSPSTATSAGSSRSASMRRRA
jgi:elongation of very long chain fatty acids protein 6